MIRTATISDADELLGIYAPYVEKTAISFELSPPSADEFRRRISSTLDSGYPYLVAEDDGAILGYAYLGAFNERAAYARSAEVSIYVRQDARGRGVGAELAAALEREAKRRRIANLYACIAYSEERPGDEFLTRRSMDFHEHSGYRLVGVFRHCAEKFNRFYDMVWMEKRIA